MRPPQDHTTEFPFPEKIEFRPIGIMRSPYKERFATPHQPTTVRGTRDGDLREGRIELMPDLPVEVLRDLEGFEYVWALYMFHMNPGWGPLVRPPRGPKRRRGVFATRSPHRPNPIGLSALRVMGVEGRAVIVRGIDLLDGTPILDLKPYVPYCDAFPEARAGWVDEVEAAERDGRAAKLALDEG